MDDKLLPFWFGAFDVRRDLPVPARIRGVVLAGFALHLLSVERDWAVQALSMWGEDRPGGVTLFTAKEVPFFIAFLIAFTATTCALKAFGWW